MRERKRDTWIASIGWGCDRAGLRGGGFVGGFWAYMVVDFGPFLSGVRVLVLVCYFCFKGQACVHAFDTLRFNYMFKS